MRTVSSTWLALALLFAIAQTRTAAHHAFAAQYDANKPITLTGTVTRLAWTNPHAHILMNVKDDGGKLTAWDFELGSPNALIRRGWTGKTLKAGDVITVSGYLAKDGSTMANARAVTLSDGKKVFAGSSFESTP